MRVLQLIGPHLNIPPSGYGGAERVVESLAAEMPRLGVEMVTFTVGTSSMGGRIAFHFDRAQPSWERTDDLIHAGKAFARAKEFDLVHCHTEYGVPFAGACQTPVLTTLHTYAAAGGQLERIIDHFPAANYVTISSSQRSLCPHLRVLATVPNCIPEDMAAAKPRLEPGGSYLIHLSRVCAAKGTDIAIHAAKMAEIPLVIAGPVFRSDADYYASEIAPHVDGVAVQYVGQVTGDDKVRVLRGALAMLAPSRWNEPFGLSLIESMAVGTPVIGLQVGALPEVVDDGVTGFIADDVSSIADGIARARFLDRGRCATAARARFSRRTMAESYRAVYQSLL